MIGSLNAYAKHRKAAGLSGGSLMAVQKARDTGRITVERDGRVDFEKSDAAWLRNTNTRQSRPPKNKARTRKKTPEKPADGSAQNPFEEREDGSFLEAQRQREWERVKKERLDNREREGILLQRADVIEQVGSLIVAAKTALRGIGAKIAPYLAAETSAAQCQAMVDAEIDEALTAISKWKPSDMKRT